MEELGRREAQLAPCGQRARKKASGGLQIGSAQEQGAGCHSRIPEQLFQGDIT